MPKDMQWKDSRYGLDLVYQGKYRARVFEEGEGIRDAQFRAVVASEGGELVSQFSPSIAFAMIMAESLLGRESDASNAETARLRLELERAYACIREMQRLALARNLELDARRPTPPASPRSAQRWIKGREHCSHETARRYPGGMEICGACDAWRWSAEEAPARPEAKKPPAASGYDGPLFGGKPDCAHEVVARSSGVECRKCGAWYCL